MNRLVLKWLLKGYFSIFQKKSFKRLLFYAKLNVELEAKGDEMMSATIISGKEVAQNLRVQLNSEVLQFIDETGVKPHLVVVLVGNNPASQSYVKGKQKGCAEVNVKSTLIELDEAVEEQELLNLIEELNGDTGVHGILVQLPLPKHIDETKVINQINVLKDVDGFHPINVGKMLIGEDCLLPCTPVGIIELIKSTNTNISGKNAVVVGRSNIVGKPVAQLLLQENATVTICHSRTKDLAGHTKMADILVVAMGRPNTITKDMVKAGAIVIDVGTTRLDDGKIHGDVQFDEVKEVAAYITPVPGGVGPMTITMLLFNTLKATKNQLN
jgi:methylenetetrahydrofolate dehydrogenase (NADP+)/methenyltetrahydrofolate cyclohydrolase